jgi:hypothetical protein
MPEGTISAGNYSEAIYILFSELQWNLISFRSYAGICHFTHGLAVSQDHGFAAG